MKRKTWIVAALVAALGLVASPVFAEHHEAKKGDAPPPYRMVHYDSIDASKVEAYEAQQKAWVEAFSKAGADEQWTWWTFQSGFEYVTGWAFANFAELDKDGDKMMAEVVGEETMKKLNEPTGAVMKHHNVIVKHNTEISYDPGTMDPANPGSYFSVGTYWIRPGSEKRFIEMAKKIKAAFEKTEQKNGYAIWMVVAGEGTFLVTSFDESAGAYYSRPEMGDILAKAYSPEEAQKLFAEWRAIAVDQQHKNYMFRKDLSYLPMPAKEAAAK